MDSVVLHGIRFTGPVLAGTMSAYANRKDQMTSVPVQRTGP